MLTRLIRNKQILKQVEDRSKWKAQCLLDSIDTTSELEVPKDCPIAAITIGLSPIV